MRSGCWGFYKVSVIASGVKEMVKIIRIIGAGMMWIIGAFGIIWMIWLLFLARLLV